ncbi:MAG: hypothetical protein ACXVDI_25245 [Ktedonobacterales bacterium]
MASLPPEQEQPERLKRPTADYDMALKKMLETAHDGFLALIAPGVQFETALPTELPATTRQADLVWAVTFDAGTTPHRQHGLLHIELQTTARPDLGERLLEYMVQLWLRERRARRAQGEVEPGISIRSIVVVLRPTTTLASPPLRISWADEQRLEFTYDVVKLWEIAPERILTTDYYQLWPLTSLMAGVTTESTVAVAQRLAEAPLPRAERSDLIGLLIVLAGLRLGRMDLSAALRRNLMFGELLKESNFAEVIYDLGREEGEAKGREEGAVQALRTSLRLVLEARFGALPNDMTVAINALDSIALTEALRHAAVEPIEQVRQRLHLR